MRKNKKISRKADTARANTVSADTTITKITSNKTDSTKFHNDTIPDQHTEVSPLDIASNRGIFILSADHMIQLRILGSVRANFNYTNKDLLNYQSFNPYEIPTNASARSPNFYIGLQQTRLGFEVTRRTKTRGDIFVRIESDFSNSTSSFRIRHAYGQFGGLLVGQTWSLFNNVSYLPAMVSKHGPAGRSGLRTPQARYSRSINHKMLWSAAIEYSATNIDKPDSINAALLQVIPDFTGRFSYKSKLISFRGALVISTISGRVDSSSISYSFGFGASFSGSLKVKKDGKLYFSITSGRSISHFMDLFDVKSEDIAYNPISNKFEGLMASGGYLAYSHNFPKDFIASLSFGMAAITNRDFQPDDVYNYSYNALLNLFWEPVNGARLGAEYAFGQRFDKGGNRGYANRLSVLIYYDF